MGDVIEFPQNELTDVPEVDLVEYVFTNDATNPFGRQILHMVYDLIFKNLIGVMQAKHKESGDIHTLLVGLEKGEGDAINTYPLARILSMDEQAEYLAPDGKGGYPEQEVKE